MSDQKKLEALLDIEGWEDEMEFAKDGMFGSGAGVAGICMNEDCEYTTNVEPDNDRGYCELCGTQTVKSGLMLMGVI